MPPILVGLHGHSSGKPLFKCFEKIRFNANNCTLVAMVLFLSELSGFYKRSHVLSNMLLGIVE